MSAQWLPLLLPVVFMAIAVVWFTRGEGQRRQRLEDGLRTGAALRGWSFEASDEGGFRLMRWRGQTDGVSWTAEYRRGHQRKRSGPSRTHRVRWWADAFQGPASPILGMGMPLGQEVPAVELAQGDGLLARMAQKAAGFALDSTLDVFFGEEVGRRVDARDLRMVQGPAQKGFIVMSVDAGATARWLAERLGPVLSAQVAAPGSAFSDNRDRPWWLWLERRVTLAWMHPVDSVEDVERLACAGVALVHAAD